MSACITCGGPSVTGYCSKRCRLHGASHNDMARVIVHPVLGDADTTHYYGFTSRVLNIAHLLNLAGGTLCRDADIWAYTVIPTWNGDVCANCMKEAAR